jgi:hypothetical protein
MPPLTLILSLPLTHSLHYLWLDSIHVIVLSYYIGFVFPIVDPTENTTTAQAAPIMRRIASQLMAVASILSTTHLSYVSKFYYFLTFVLQNYDGKYIHVGAIRSPLSSLE